MFADANRMTPEQRRAVEYGGGHLLIVAGAGTGKTTTLSARLGHLVASGVAPERVLLLTFSRRAATELLHRAEQVAGRDVIAATWGGTFHAIANRLLRRHGRALGIEPGFTVMDRSDTADLLSLVRDELGAGTAGAGAGGAGAGEPATGQHRRARKETLADILSRCINARTPLSAMLRAHYPWCADEREELKATFGAYTTRKRSRCVLDYDDLLLCWGALLEVPDVAQLLQAQFDHILVDEYQDTNPLQADLLEAMCRGGATLTAVGDDAQAIYAFRAASHRNIMEFPTRFGAEVVTLEQNHRSTPLLLAVTNALIAEATERHPKHLWSRRENQGRPALVRCVDEADQSRQVCARILEHHERGTRLMGQAVLVRSAHHSDGLELELTARNIPYVKYGGLRFLEAAHVKDLLCLLRLAENPRDELAWFRVLQYLEDVGPTTARRLTASLLGQMLPVAHLAAGAGSGPGSGSGSGSGPGSGSGSGSGSGELAGPGSRDGRGSGELAGPGSRDGRGSGELAGRGSRDGRGSGEPAADLLGPALALPTGAREAAGELAAALAEAGELGPAGAGPAVERVRQWLDPRMEQRYNHVDARRADLQQLTLAAAGSPSLRQFLADLTLDPPASTSELAGPPHLDEDFITISTIHSAKGCEWDVVHVIHLADGNIPSDLATGDAEAIEEERRLLYVAMTRARNHLYAYLPLRYHHRRLSLDDPHGYAQLTRFFTPAVLSVMDDPGPPSATSPREAGPLPHGLHHPAMERLDRALAGLWD